MIHKSVMLKEVINTLQLESDNCYIDLTLGAGGYTKEIDKRISNSLIVCFDQDINAVNEFVGSIKAVGSGISEYPTWIYKGVNTIVIVNTNFCNLTKVVEVLKREELIDKKIKGVVADLGFSTDQLNSISGLSFKDFNADLDMRMDISLAIKASDILNALSKKELEKIFFEYADEPRGAKIAEMVVKKRKDKKFQTVGDFVHVLEAFRIEDKEDFRQRIFQSLRIAVNSELVNLKEVLEQSAEVLEQNGIACFLSFHSGEDRIIKSFIKESKDLVTEIEFEGESILRPTELEVSENPKSRSAKLRAFKKL